MLYCIIWPWLFAIFTPILSRSLNAPLCYECRVPRDINCLRVVDCISRVNKRCKQLRSVVAYQILVMFFENKVTYFLILWKLKFVLKHQIEWNIHAKIWWLMKVLSIFLLANYCSVSFLSKLDGHCFSNFLFLFLIKCHLGNSIVLCQ